jgi:hypothetical protein
MSISSRGVNGGRLCKRACRNEIQRRRKTSKNFLQKLFFRVSCFSRCFWATSITSDTAMSSDGETLKRSAPFFVLVKNSPYIWGGVFSGTGQGPAAGNNICAERKSRRDLTTEVTETRRKKAISALSADFARDSARHLSQSPQRTQRRETRSALSADFGARRGALAENAEDTFTTDTHGYTRIIEPESALSADFGCESPRMKVATKTR